MTQDIRSLIPYLMHHAHMLPVPFLGARVDQLLEKWLAPVKVGESQHPANGVSEPLAHVIDGLLHLLHHQPTAFEAFGKGFPPGEQRCPILLPGFLLATGFAEIHIGTQHAHEELAPIFRRQREQRFGTGLGAVLFQLEFPPNAIVLCFRSTFLFEFQPFVIDAQHGLALTTAEVQGVAGGRPIPQ